MFNEIKKIYSEEITNKFVYPEGSGQNGIINLSRLITYDGQVVEKPGYAEEGVGIYDDEHNYYAGGFDENGKLYADTVDEQNRLVKDENEVITSPEGEEYKLD